MLIMSGRLACLGTGVREGTKSIPRVQARESQYSLYVDMLMSERVEIG